MLFSSGEVAEDARNKSFRGDRSSLMNSLKSSVSLAEAAMLQVLELFELVDSRSESV